MKTMISTPAAGLLAGLILVSVAWAEQPDFSRYQVIIDRNLFGEIAPDLVPGAGNQPVAPSPRSFIETLRLCGIHDSKEGAWVSFVDVGINPNKSYTVKVGEDNGDGITVLDADVVGGTALLKKGDEEKRLTMEQTPAPAAVVGRPHGLPGPGFVRTPPPPVAPPSMAPPPTANPQSAVTSSSVMMERLRQRREMLEKMKAAATSPPPPAVTAPTNTVVEMSPQERMKKLREYNLELIKAKGAKGPPLPIQLTPEEDDQLVKEGVLPPPGAATPAAE